MNGIYIQKPKIIITVIKSLKMSLFMKIWFEYTNPLERIQNRSFDDQIFRAGSRLSAILWELHCYILLKQIIKK